jgi:NAD(P)-dependent dehydrogenase (short-subunit alcohol dehydrogenase family)
MVEYMKVKLSTYPPYYEKLQQRIPIGRAGNREDLFEIAVFLASNASVFINGAIILVDGGAIASDGFPVVLSADS